MTTRELAESCFRTKRILAGLENVGIALTCEFRKTYSQITMRQGRLDNGLVTTNIRSEISGNTYNVRGVLKAHGYRWDSKLKVWHYPADLADINAVGGEILRKLAA